MSTLTYAGPLGEVRAASAAGGGTALSTTATLVVLPRGSQHLVLTARNFATAVVAKVAVNPYLAILRTNDNLATGTDASDNAQDGVAATTVSLAAQKTIANGGLLLVGSHLPFRGVKVAIGSANALASVLTVRYWNGTAWTDTSATDGTTSAGATLAVGGNVTWTVPTDWAEASLATIATPAPAAGVVLQADRLFWTRWGVSALLSAGTALTEMWAFNRATAYWELTSGQSLEQYIFRGLGGVASVEALSDAGTANLIVNVGTGRGTRFA